MAIIKHASYTVTYNDGPETKEAVFNAVMDYFKTHQTFCGESLQQMDSPIEDAPNVLSDIADNIIGFKQEWK